MGFSPTTLAAFAAIRVTAELAAATTLILLVVGTPVAWWLARTRSPVRSVVAALVALPIVLPPSVLGFYLLLWMGPDGALGRITEALGIGRLPFTFWGLVVGSVLYSLPFVVQPLQQSFEAVEERALEAAATLGAPAWDRFFTVALPLARPGLLTAAVLGFAHTVGEFGVVLMIGGNIEGRTRTLSVLVFDQVEAGNIAQAHGLALGLVVFSLAVLLALYRVGRAPGRRVP